MLLLRPCSLVVRFQVASEARLGLESKVELLGPVYVSGGGLRDYGEVVETAVSRSGQRYDIARGAMEAHTILPSGTLPAGGDGDACSTFLFSPFWTRPALL